MDFDAVTASPMPGTTYFARMPFRGLIVATHFEGQIPVLRQGYRHPFGDLAGAPGNPLREARKRGSYSELNVIATENEDVANALSSWASAPNKPRSSLTSGRGSIAVKFTNPQLVFGFRLIPLTSEEGSNPNVVIRLYDEIGRRLGPPIQVTEFGEFTWLHRDALRRIKGFEVVNPGGARVAMDAIVFELPILIGRLSKF